MDKTEEKKGDGKHTNKGKKRKEKERKTNIQNARYNRTKQAK